MEAMAHSSKNKIFLLEHCWRAGPNSLLNTIIKGKPQYCYKIWKKKIGSGDTGEY